MQFAQREFDHQKLNDACIGVPIEKLYGFLSWAIATEYMLPKPEYRGLKMADGSEWAARFVLGEQAEYLTIGGQVCFGRRLTGTVVP